MSDEDILAMGEQPTQETSNYPEGEANEPKDEADVSNKPEGDSENPESEVPSTKEESNAEETGEIDYKAVYEKLFKPFKANGKEISVETPEEAIALMQQGANYNKKMASLKPNLKIIKMLEKNGLLDESKLSYLIDIDKKNPNALRKLFKESDIDLYGYDAEDSDEGTYQPTQYSVPDSEMEFDTVVEELQDSPMFSNTDYYVKKALIDLKKEQYFTQLADTTTIPKHHGKTIKQFVYIPLLDDRNINDQGIDAQGVKSVNGNLYGSSKDIGTIPGKLPVLSETGGRVNRVGFTRKQIEGSFAKYSFFTEYTQESLDSEKDVVQQIYCELLCKVNELIEDTLQIDLLNAARTIRYPGTATQNSNISASTVVTFKDLVDLARDLDNARTPKHTTIIAGSRLTDTRTIPDARVLYIGSELEYTLRKMKDFHNNPAFIPVEKYADAGNILTGEIGAIHQFRVVVVPEMLKWPGAGATASGGLHYETGGNIDVFPMLVVGDKSFTTIAFKTDGKSNKFIMKHKKPGEITREDPYGETGIMSIKWYYGFMPLRPERIGLIKTAAEM